MKKFFNYLWRHKGVLAVFVLVLAAAAFLVVRRINANAASATTYETVTVGRGTLTASIGATGNVRAYQSVLLAWQTSGSVQDVNVQIGDRVEAGEVLAGLATSSLSQNLILAQADLVAARRNLETLQASDTPRAQAQLALITAQQKYDNAKSTLDGLLASNRGASSDNITYARSQVTLAENSLTMAQNAYNLVADRPDDDPAKASAYSALYAARQNLDRAENSLDFFLLVPSGKDIDKARANLALASAQLADAQREWDRLKDGPDSNDLLAAQARLDAAQAAVALAQIKAPFAGVITDAVPLPGDQVTPGTLAFRLDNLSHLLVEVQVSEVDINRVRLGQPVVITFDAIQGREYTGLVVEVAQAASVVGGVVNFAVTVEIADADEQVKPGMTAAITITVEQLEDVLIIPNRSVRLLNGKRYVFAIRGGQVEQVEVTLGASSNNNSQVVAGDLQEGDEIILNPPAELTRPDGMPGFFGP